MLSATNRYVVKITSRPFVSEAGRSYPSTATVTVFDENENTVLSNDYGYLPTEDIYAMVESGQEINLDNCYVSNFSVTAYRRTRLMPKNEQLQLRGFSARHAVFNSSYRVDFSHVDFADYPVTFHGSYFVNGLVTFHACRFGRGVLDFNSAVFRGGCIDFSGATKVSGEVNFKNAVFARGEKNFQDADLGSGNKSFSNCDFGGGQVRFINTRFGDGKTSFKLAKFGDGTVDFHFSSWSNGFLSFENACFGNGQVNFEKIDFGYAKVNFNRSTFANGDISFEGCELKRSKFTIKWVNFGSGNINFERAEMATVELSFDKASFDKGSTSRVSFNRSKFKSLSLRSCHLDDYFDLRVAQCEYLDLSNTVVRDIIDLKAYDYDIDIGTLDMAHMRLLGIIDIDWHANNVARLIKSQQHRDKWITAEQFRVLKENFNKTGRYSDEDKAYIEFKRHEQRAILEENIRKSRASFLWQYPYYWFKTLLFDKIGLYATEPTRVLLSMLIVYFSFSLTYIAFYLLGLGDIVTGIDPRFANLTIVGRSFYFGAVTFFTIGYGDFYPVGIFRWFSCVEGFTGMFLMSFFTVAFVRKILR